MSSGESETIKLPSNQISKELQECCHSAVDVPTVFSKRQWSQNSGTRFGKTEATSAEGVHTLILGHPIVSGLGWEYGVY